MNKNDGKTWFGLGIDNSGLRSDADKSIGIFNQIGNKAEAEGARVDTSFKRIAGGIAGLFATGVAKSIIDDIARVRNEFEQLEISFTTMLGSREKANALMQKAISTASKTPFDLSGVASGYKQLLAYGIALEKVDDTLKMVGDVASGVSAPLNDIVYLYGTLNASGRVALMDIRQFAGRGIPIYEELAKVLGIAKEQVNEFASDGKISFEHVEQAFKNMTSEGGRFNNLMEAQSKSIGGMKANFGDAIDQMKNDLGKKLEPIIKGTIKNGIELAENYEAVGKILIGLAGVYGTYKTAVIVANTINQLSIGIKLASALAGHSLTLSEILLTAKTNLQSAAQARLNAIMLANPYMLVGIAVVALAGTIALWVTRTDAAEQAQKRLNKSVSEFDVQANSEISTLNRLKGELEGTRKGTEEYKTTKDAIVSQFGKYYSNLGDEIERTGTLSSSYDQLAISIRNAAMARGYDTFMKGEQDNADKATAKKYEKIQSTLLDKLGDEEGSEVYAQIRDALVNNQAIPAAITAILDKVQKKGTVLARSNVDQWISDIQETYKNLEVYDKKAKDRFGVGGGVIKIAIPLKDQITKPTKTEPTAPIISKDKSGNAWDAELKAIEDYAKKEEIITLTMQKNNLINQETYELISQRILLSSLQKKIALLGKYGQDTLNLEKQALEADIKLKEVTGKITQPKLTPFEVAPVDKEELNKGLRLYLDYVEGKEKAEKEFNEWVDEQVEKKHEKLVEYVYATADIINSVTDVVDSFGGDTRQLDNVTKLVGGVATAGQGVAKIMSGDIVGGITDTVRGLADIIISINAISDTERQKEIEKMQDKVEGLQEAYDNLGDKIEKAYSKDASKMIEQQNVMLKQQQLLLKQQIAQEKAKKKTDEAKIKEWEKEYEEINKLIDDNKEKAVDVIFGEDVQNAIDGFADAYVSAWEAGEDKMKSSKDLAKKMIKSMLVEAIKANIGDAFVSNLRAKMKEFMDNDGRIDSAEQTIIDSMVEGLTKQLDAEFGWADAYLRGSSSQGAASYGAYEKITQEQASGIDGRLTGIHMEVVKQSGSLALIEQDMKKVRDNTVISGETLSEMRDIALLSVGHLERIGKNTNELYEMNARLGRIEKNTSNL